MEVIAQAVKPSDEPRKPREELDPGYRQAPKELMDPVPGTDGLSAWWYLRAAARKRNGNQILRWVAQLVYENSLPKMSYPVSQTMLTAMTQLAATGSNAYQAWIAEPIEAPGLTECLTNFGMPLAEAQFQAEAIWRDFDAARTAVRNPLAGVPPTSLRGQLPASGWIAVLGEVDPPDFPVNIAIAPHPQFHVSLTVPCPARVDGIPLSVRYIVASRAGIPIPEGVATNPSPVIPEIPPDDEVILYIHGEGSRAEEAVDFIEALHQTALHSGRSFTVIVLDLPGCGYTTSVIDGLHETVEHEQVAKLPSIGSVGGVGIDLGPGLGSSLLDFAYSTIVEFVDTVVEQQGKTVTAVVGGSLGGHMALRLAASGAAWVKHVIAWSPASVWDRTSPLELATGTLNIENRTLSDPQAAYRARAAEQFNATKSEGMVSSSRSEYFQQVFYEDTVNITGIGATLLAVDLVASGLLAFLGWFLSVFVVADVAGAILNMPTIPPQPQMWYRDDWGQFGGGQALPCAPPPNATHFGQAKLVYICEGQLDRAEVYNEHLRQWHWRIAGECIWFSFRDLISQIETPLLLMVGDQDSYALVDFRSNVMSLGAELQGPGRTQEIKDTGHSIHNERPYFLAEQLIAFTPQRQLAVTVAPSAIHMNRPMDITITAVDAVTREPVIGSEVLITNFTPPKPSGRGGDPEHIRGSADVPFKRRITFHYGREYEGENRRVVYDIEPEISVTAPTYIEATAPVTFLEH